MSERVTHKIRIVVLVLSMILCFVSLTGCEGFNSAIQDRTAALLETNIMHHSIPMMVRIS